MSQAVYTRYETVLLKEEECKGVVCHLEAALRDSLCDGVGDNEERLRACWEAEREKLRERKSWRTYLESQ